MYRYTLYSIYILYTCRNIHPTSLHSSSSTLLLLSSLNPLTALNHLYRKLLTLYTLPPMFALIDCKLKTIPEDVYGLAELECLFLDNNSITNLHLNVTRLTNLKVY